MTKKRILVCGATGFIGRNLAEHLAANDAFEVIGTHSSTPPFAHDKIRFVHADLTQREDLERVVQGVDVILQAAATTSGAKDIVQRPYIHVTDNAVMNSLLFRAAHDARVGCVVFFSCSVMYQPGKKPVRECDLNLAEEMHPSYFGGGWTKVYLEKIAEFYAWQGATRFLVIRHSNVYGPYDKYDLGRSHVFGATIAKVFQAEDGRVVVWGSGEEKRDLLHVSDLVRFVDLALNREKRPFALFNVGSGICVSVAELVRKIIDASGRQLRIEYDLSQPTIPTSLSLDITRARQEIGWEPTMSLDDGIRETIRWYRDYYRV